MEIWPALEADGLPAAPDGSSETEDTPRGTPTPGAMSQARRCELLGRIAFLEAEAEKLMEHSRRCCSHAEEMQGLLARLHAQKAVLERLLQTEDAVGPELDAWTGPCELTEVTARAYLLWLRRLLHELSQAIDQSSTAAAAAGQSARLPNLSCRRHRDAPSRIFPDLEVLDITAVVGSAELDLHYLPAGAGGGGGVGGGGVGGGGLLSGPAEGWRPLPRRTLYCVTGDAREISVVGLAGELLARLPLDGEAETAGRSLERIKYLRTSGLLLLSDYQSLYICDQRCRVLRALHSFGWIVGHCVDEASDRLFVADRVNESVSLYGLTDMAELGRLSHRDFTDGISSVCALRQLLFVSDRGANAIFAFASDSLQLAFRVAVRNPLFLTSDTISCLYVTVGGRDNTVMILDAQGQLRRKLSGGRGSQPGQFGSPSGLTVSTDGSELFVCDLDNRRVQVFRL